MFNLFRFKENKRRKFLETWLHLILKSMKELPPSIPKLGRADATFFIDEWIRLYENSDNESRVGLAVLAYRVEIHRYAAGMLIARNKTVRRAGIKMLGYMRDETAWPLLIRIVQNDKPELALPGLRALFQINEQRALGEFLSEIIKRTDWPRDDVVSIIDEITDSELRRQVLEKINAATPKKMSVAASLATSS